MLYSKQLPNLLIKYVPGGLDYKSKYAIFPLVEQWEVWKMKAAIYARTSSDDAEDRGNKVSIEEQIAQCKEFAAKQGYQVLMVERDRDRSGRTRLNEIEAIIVIDPTRLMRPLRNSDLESWMMDTLEMSKIKILCVQGGDIDPAKWSDSLVAGLNYSIQDQMIKGNLEKSAASRLRKMDTGYLTYGALGHGYRSSGHQKVEIVEREAQTVRQIFKLFLAGFTLCAIAKELNKDNAKWWTVQELHKVLKRPQYAGMQWNSKHELITCIPLTGKALISLDDWRKAQERFKVHRNAGHKIRKGILHPLTGLLTCGVCGKRLTLMTTKAFVTTGMSTSYYQCASATVGGSEACKDTRIRERGTIHQTGLLEVLRPLCYQGYYELVKERLQDKELIAKKNELEERLKAATEHSLFLSVQRRDGRISSEVFMSMLEENEGVLKGLKQDIDRVKTKLEGMQKVEDIDAEELAKSLFNLSDDTIKKYLPQIVKEVKVFPYHIEVFLTSGDSFKLERIPDRNARRLPNYQIGLAKAGQELSIIYIYKSADGDMAKLHKMKRTEICKTPWLKIMTVGENPKPFQEQLRKRRRPTPLILPDYLQS